MPPPTAPPFRHAQDESEEEQSDFDEELAAVEGAAADEASASGLRRSTCAARATIHLLCTEASEAEGGSDGEGSYPRAKRPEKDGKKHKKKKKSSGGFETFGWLRRTGTATLSSLCSRPVSWDVPRHCDQGLQAADTHPAPVCNPMRHRPTHVAASRSIPTILEGRDVVGMARTGSGKTAAFLIPMIERLRSHSAVVRPCRKSSLQQVLTYLQVGIRGLVMSPTRELAIQTLKFTKVRWDDAPQSNVMRCWLAGACQVHGPARHGDSGR